MDCQGNYSYRSGVTNNNIPIIVSVNYDVIIDEVYYPMQYGTGSVVYWMNAHLHLY